MPYSLRRTRDGAGAKDDNNLPNHIHICPAYGCDWFQVYEKTDKTFGPEW